MEHFPGRQIVEAAAAKIGDDHSVTILIAHSAPITNVTAATVEGPLATITHGTSTSHVRLDMIIGYSTAGKYNLRNI